MTESERNLGRRWFELVWNQRRREAIAEMLAPQAIAHDGSSEATGPDGFYPFYDRMLATFSEIHVDVHDSIAEGDKICVRWTFTGKHTGDGLGAAPTGTAVHVTGITIMRVSGGRMVEGWQNWDMLGMMERINGVARSATYIG
jgi:predicted ester cyclase